MFCSGAAEAKPASWNNEACKSFGSSSEEVDCLVTERKQLAGFLYSTSLKEGDKVTMEIGYERKAVQVMGEGGESSLHCKVWFSCHCIVSALIESLSNRTKIEIINTG